MKTWASLTGVLPYATAIFKIYQPLFRWKSRIIGDRFDKFFNAHDPTPAEQVRTAQREPLPGQSDLVARPELATDTGGQALSIRDLEPITVVSEVEPHLAPTIDCGIARLLQRDIGSNPPRDWGRLITNESMAMLLEKLNTIVAKPNELQKFPDIADYVQSFTRGIDSSDPSLTMQSLLNKEARVSNFLLFLSRHKPTQLDDLFFTVPHMDNPPAA